MGYRQVLNAAPVTAFSDTFIRANKDTLGSQWMRTLQNAPGGGGNGATASAQIVTNQAVFTTVAGAGPTQNYLPAWIPLPVYLNNYNAAGLFVQCTFQADVGAGSAGMILRYNHDLDNTETQGEGQDVYMCLMKGAAAGRIDKIVGGGGASSIGLGTWGALTAGQVIRFECLTVGSKVTLQTIRNGVILQTIDDSSATRILVGGVALGYFSISATGQALTVSAFSCGRITALST